MKNSLRWILVCFTVVVFARIGFAQENAMPSVPGAENTAPMMEQPSNLEIPIQPAAADMVATPQIQEPQIEIPVPTVETQVADEETLTPADSHVIIEAVTDTASHPSIKEDPNAYNRIKQLAGRWEGMGNKSTTEKNDTIVVDYEVTAGGYAVLERLFPGTNQEMVTMYYDDHGQLALTHYCMIGTRSVMKLKPVVADSEGKTSVFEFELVDSPGLDTEVDTHMHSLKITFLDDNRIVQEWTMFEAGKPSGSYTFKLTRPPTSD